MTGVSTDDPDGGTCLGAGAGFVKNKFPNFGFIRTDAGEDLFFMPTNVDSAICPFRNLDEGCRVTFEKMSTRRGLRARKVQRQAETDAS